MKDNKTKLNVEVLSYTPDIEKLISASARLCYSKSDIADLMVDDKEANEKFIKRLISMGHESPLEHGVITFGIEGVSRSLTHQLVRHRIASFSQQSQRYVAETQFEYVIPPAIENHSIAREMFISAMEESQKTYDKIVTELLNDYMVNDLVNRSTRVVIRGRNGGGIKKFYIEQFGKKDFNALHKKAIEDSRYVFPNAIETKITMTMNVRSLFNFFELRTCNRASWEIRELADEMLRECKKISPTLFSKAGATCLYGKCSEGAMSCGEPRTPDEYEITSKAILDEVENTNCNGCIDCTCEEELDE